jgi:hypothetical protein
MGQVRSPKDHDSDDGTDASKEKKDGEHPQGSHVLGMKIPQIPRRGFNDSGSGDVLAVGEYEGECGNDGEGTRYDENRPMSRSP